MTVKVYRERGLASLIQRIFSYVKEFARALFIRSGDALYISGCPGGSRFYRCRNQGEELELYGIKARAVSQDNLNLNMLIKKFEVFIFQRVIYNKHIESVINFIKKEGKTIIFETDDLVFDPRFISHMHYFNFFGEEEKGWYRNGIGREILEDPYVRDCIVSTHYLADRLREKYPRKNIFISTNKLGNDQVRWAREALANKDKIKPKDGKVRIGYFSGSRSHDSDFETISKVLLRILRENKNVVLMTVGHLELNGEFSRLKNQIEKFSFVPLKKLSELILRSDINVVPLEIDNPFCQAKSALKFFEAGVLEIPTVASATDSFQRVIENEKNGFLAKNENDWYKYLMLLIKNENLRKEIGQNARESSLEKHTTQKVHSDTEKLAKFIKQKINDSKSKK